MQSLLHLLLHLVLLLLDLLRYLVLLDLLLQLHLLLVFISKKGNPEAACRCNSSINVNMLQLLHAAD